MIMRVAVSYTHLDVYKRQVQQFEMRKSPTERTKTYERNGRRRRTRELRRFFCPLLDPTTRDSILDKIRDDCKVVSRL